MLLSVFIPSMEILTRYTKRGLCHQDLPLKNGGDDLAEGKDKESWDMHPGFVLIEKKDGEIKL